MLPYSVSVLLDFSILISVIISLQKLRDVRKEYLPFIVSVWVNLLGCIATEIAIYFWRSNGIIANFYFIIFCLLILWQFKRWGLFSDRPAAFYVMLGVFVLVWSVDNLVIGTLYKFNPYARIINSMAIVLLSVHLLSSELVDEAKSFWKSSKQLILMTYILLFTIKMITEFFWQYGIQLGDSFMVSIFLIYQYINFTANLLYAYAMLWIPLTTRYFWP